VYLGRLRQGIQTFHGAKEPFEKAYGKKYSNISTTKIPMGI
jgi:hypothetical protein